MADPKIVLLNDTDVDGYHFGCAKVMGNMRDHLAKRGATPIGSVKVSLDWRIKDEALINAADLLIINGEGTLHHGSRRGRWLLEAACSMKARGGKVALINALWQDNPADWTDLIRDADILSCRDSRSVQALSQTTGRSDVRFIGDLSMSQPIAANDRLRSGIMFGDSVHAEITKRLAALCTSTPDAKIIPVTSSLKFVSPHLTGLRRRMRSAYAVFKQNRYLSQHPTAQFVGDTNAYIDALSGKSLSVTGRFHAVCLAIATRTPFVAVKSNSWKIEALIDDIGLSKDRRVALNNLDADMLDPARWAYTPQELSNIDDRLTQWQDKTDQLFDDILATANTPQI